MFKEIGMNSPLVGVFMLCVWLWCAWCGDYLMNVMVMLNF